MLEKSKSACTADGSKGWDSGMDVPFCPDDGLEALGDQLQQVARHIAENLSSLESAHRKELLVEFVSELFAASSEQERRAERRRKQAEGIAAAKARGVRFGAERKPLPDNFNACCEAWQSGQVTAAEAAAMCGMPRKSFYRARKRLAEERGGEQITDKSCRT